MLDVLTTQEREIIDFRNSELKGIVLLGRYHYKNVKENLILHKHEGCIEIVYIEKGTQKYWVNDKYYNSKGGDVFISFPGELHGSFEYPEEKGNIYWIIIKATPGIKHIAHLNSYASKMLLGRLLNIKNRHFKGSMSMKTILSKIFSLYRKDKGSFQNIEIGNLISLFLAEIIRSSEYFEITGENISAAISVAIDYIFINIRETIVIEQLAEKCNLSVSHFKYRFKKETGCTPGDYILRCKVEEAQKMLSKPDVKISDIAYTLGFDNPSYFATIFKRYKGKSPTNYRLFNK